MHLDKELEKVVALVGKKFGEFANLYMEAMKAKDAHLLGLLVKVASLEDKLEVPNSTNVLLASLVLALQNWVGELEDMMLVDLEEEESGPSVLSSLLTDVDLVENMVVIPVPASSVIHTLIPIETPPEYILLPFV